MSIYTFTHYISKNEKLLAFCNKIIAINHILNNEESRYMFLASLISIDALYGEHSYEDSINMCYFIKNNISLMMFDDPELSDEIIKYVDDSLKVLQEEYQKIKK